MPMIGFMRESLYDFTWYYGDGSSYAGTNPSKYEYKQNGLYDVALHAIEKSTGCANQLVKPEWILCDGGSEINEQEIAFYFYPNPVSNRLYLEKSEDMPCQIHIYNLSGKLLYEGMWLDKMQAIEMHAYPAGIYLIKIVGSFGMRVEKGLKE